MWVLILIIRRENNACVHVCVHEDPPPLGKSAFTHEVGQRNLPKLGQWQSMGAILDKRRNKRGRGKKREKERESTRLGEQNQAAYFILAFTLS